MPDLGQPFQGDSQRVRLCGIEVAAEVSLEAPHEDHVGTLVGGPTAVSDVGEGAATIVWLATDAPRDLTGKFVKDRKVIPW